MVVIRKVNSKAFAIPILTASYIIKADTAVRIGIANALELTFLIITIRLSSILFL